MKLEEEIRQPKFSSEFQKAHINILFTASYLSQQSSTILKPFNITWQQFNILRILRGMHPQPASVKVLTERMIDKMSNASRLVDKLLQKGLVDRVVCAEDRRRVNIHITDEGLALLEESSKAMEKRFHEESAGLTEEEAVLLNALLDNVRSVPFTS